LGWGDTVRTRTRRPRRQPEAAGCLVSLCAVSTFCRPAASLPPSSLPDRFPCGAPCCAPPPRPQLTPPPLGCATGGARRGACAGEQRRGRGSGRVSGGAPAGGGRREPHAGHPPLQLPGLVSGFVRGFVSGSISGFVRGFASCAASCAASSAASGVASRGLLLPGSRRSVESRGVGAPCAEAGARRRAGVVCILSRSCTARAKGQRHGRAPARGAPCRSRQQARAGAARVGAVRAAIDQHSREGLGEQ